VEGVNSVVLVGHLSRDAERVPVDWPLLKFTVAVAERRWTPKGWMSSTGWHNVIMRGKRVPVYEKKLKKGTPVYLEGRLINRTYVGKDGIKRYVTEVEVSGKLIMFPKRGIDGGVSEAEAPEEESESKSEVKHDVKADGEKAMPKDTNPEDTFDEPTIEEHDYDEVPF
jgi:single-strand DNA-binding protein